MKCHHCGAENPDNAFRCKECNNILLNDPPEPERKKNKSRFESAQERNIPSYLGEAIAVTLLCCLPVGLFAIISSVKTMEAKSAGNTKSAQKHSDDARAVCWFAFGCGIVFYLICAFIKYYG